MIYIKRIKFTLELQPPPFGFSFVVLLLAHVLVLGVLLEQQLSSGVLITASVTLSLEQQFTLGFSIIVLVTLSLEQQLSFGFSLHVLAVLLEQQLSSVFLTTVLVTLSLGQQLSFGFSLTAVTVLLEQQLSCLCEILLLSICLLLFLHLELLFAVTDMEVPVFQFFISNGA
jgi:hypothetical protein